MSMKEGVVTEATNTVDKHGVDLGESHHIERPHGARVRKAMKKKNETMGFSLCIFLRVITGFGLSELLVVVGGFYGHSISWNVLKQHLNLIYLKELN